MSLLENVKTALKQGHFFKFICAVGNEDLELVRRLTLVYALAGSHVIDVAADIAVINAAQEGIARAAEFAALSEHYRQPTLMVSVGLKEDPHMRKAVPRQIACSRCQACLAVCIHHCLEFVNGRLRINAARCIGCGKCSTVCREEMFDFVYHELDLKAALMSCLAMGAEMVELHASTPNTAEILAKWQLINEITPPEMLLACSIGSGRVAPQVLMEQVKEIYKLAGDRTIIQADGIPMGGGDTGPRITLQAVAACDLVLRSGVPVYLIASGGTNDQTARLARALGVKINGVGIGSFARKLVMPEVQRDDFYTPDVIQQAVQKAKALVESVKAGTGTGGNQTF